MPLHKVSRIILIKASSEFEYPDLKPNAGFPYTRGESMEFYDGISRPGNSYETGKFLLLVLKSSKKYSPEMLHKSMKKVGRLKRIHFLLSLKQ